VASSRRTRIRSVAFDELSTDALARWSQLQDDDPALDSPYFHPFFTAAVAATDRTVRVILGEESDGEITSFLPLQVHGRTATAAGYPAADFQGPICVPSLPLDLPGTLDALGVGVIRFDHLRDGVTGVDTAVTARRVSPFIDISGGEEGYRSRASRAGRDNLAQARRHARKAERVHGEYRFVANSRDPGLLDQVIELKRRQYHATGARDYFADPAHRHLLEQLVRNDPAQERTMLSAIYAGEHLLSAHFGLRHRGVLHWWFPVYDPDFAGLAPGWLLLRALIQSGPELGLERIDLGRGEDEYKRRAMTGQQYVFEANAYASALRRRLDAGRTAAIDRIKSSRAAPKLRELLQQGRRLRH
jgi:CelD/BcsL family acetyltransferase involved in cellulose biosynthesis